MERFTIRNNEYEATVYDKRLKIFRYCQRVFVDSMARDPFCKDAFGEFYRERFIVITGCKLSRKQRKLIKNV